MGRLLKDVETTETPLTELEEAYKKVVEAQDKKIALLETMIENLRAIEQLYEKKVAAYAKLNEVNKRIIEKQARALKLAVEVIEERQDYAKHKGILDDPLQT
jgi:hypothetical protein